MRRTNLAALNASTPLTLSSFASDNASRLSAVTNGSFNALYTYVANSPLVSQITFRSNSTTRMTTTKQWDFLNRLSSISSSFSSSSSSSNLSFAYLYNDANQRIRNGLADGSFWLYEYDSLGQVRSGKKYWSDGTKVLPREISPCGSSNSSYFTSISGQLLLCLCAKKSYRSQFLCRPGARPSSQDSQA